MWYDMIMWYDIRYDMMWYDIIYDVIWHMILYDMMIYVMCDMIYDIWYDIQ